MGESSPDERYYVEVVAEASALLRTFANAPYRFTLTEMSVASGLSKNKTFRLLYTLAYTGLVQQDAETKRYTLGLPLLHLASIVQGSNELLLAARDTLDWLQDTVGERINLGTYDGPDHAICVDTRESARRLTISARIGVRLPLHAGAIPKALLAFSTDAQIASYLERNLPLRQFTPRTATTAEALWDDLRAIRRGGFAVSDEDLDEAVCALGAPIFDRHGMAVAAVSIAVPIERFGQDERDEYEVALQRASERISRNLGFVVSFGRQGLA